MRNLANIGFEVHSLEEFQALAEMVYHKGQSYRAGRNQYYAYQDSSGGELWVQIDSEEQIAGMNCHFHSANSIDVTLTHAQGYEDRPLDGTFEARAMQVDAGLPPSAALPEFVFDLPDAHLVPHVSLPAQAKVQLVGFARDVHVYENVEDYRKAQPGKPLEGLRPVEQDRPENKQLSSLMRLDGIVVAAELKHNAYTKQAFYWLEVKTVFGHIDVVVASRALPFVPQQGQVLDAEVRLSGRVQIKDAHAQKPGLIERMFWR